MTAVFTISASGEHLDAATLALLAEVELDEMSIRALSEDLAVDSEPVVTFGSPSDLANPSADEPATAYPWTTNGLLDAAKHLSTCNQCTTERTALLASFNTAWHEPNNPLVFTSPTLTDQTLMDRHIATALSAFDETVSPAVVPVAVKGKQQEPARFLSGLGKQKSGSQDAGVSGWRTSGFGRAIGLRRNQVLIGFATLAIAVPLLLQLRPTDQFGGVALKTADTTAAAFETSAAAAEFANETQALAAETTAAMAAETMAAAGDISATADTVARIPAAKLNQAVEDGAAKPAAGGDKGLAAAGTPPPNPAPAADAVEEIAATAIDARAVENEVLPVPVLTLPRTATAPAAAPKATIDAAGSQQRAKDQTQGAAARSGSTSASAPTASPVTTPAASPKPAAKRKQAPTKGSANVIANVTASPSPAATAATAPLPEGTISLDPSVLNLGNLGPEADPSALVSRFRTIYDRVRPPGTPLVSGQTQTSLPSAPVTPAPAPAVAAAPVAPAPAVAASADPVFAETATPTALGSQSVDRCVTNLFGATDRQVIAVASATLGNRPVWLVRVQSGTGTADLILNMTSCAELLRQPVP